MRVELTEESFESLINLVIPSMVNEWEPVVKWFTFSSMQLSRMIKYLI